MMCSSYPGHSCFIFDLYQQPFPGREEEEKYFQNYSPVVNQHIPRLGFLLWAERGAALGAGMGPQSAPSSPLPIPETTQPCSHQSSSQTERDFWGEEHRGSGMEAAVDHKPLSYFLVWVA